MGSRETVPKFGISSEKIGVTPRSKWSPPLAGLHAMHFGFAATAKASPDRRGQSIAKFIKRIATDTHTLAGSPVYNGFRSSKRHLSRSILHLSKLPLPARPGYIALR